jgi:anthranilate/para-aminobenzoate synthase component I
MPIVLITPLDKACDPLEVARRFAREAGLAWLDGGLEHGREGRFSYIATAPCDVRLRALGDARPFALLDELVSASSWASHAPSGEGLPFAPETLPCWVGHVCYDAGLSPALRGARSEPLPALRFARYDAWYVFDHERACSYLASDDEAAQHRALARLAAAPVTPEALAFVAGPVEAPPGEQHVHAVTEALALIREGEVYEINLARRLRATFSGSALGLYLRMRELSPVPLGYFVDGGDHAVLGRSMERFLRFCANDRRLWCSPIKGTLARAGDDSAEALLLRADPKEHAEHAMVVDLMRNDLSRVCEVGTVEIAELMAVLPFAGLSHLVSTVEGRMRRDVGLGTLLELTFPPGSVTGAPKERVLKAIEALEPHTRGLYTGCVGFIDRAGGCSFAVAIRTAVIAEGEVSYCAGGGIVADSIPERELNETELKAQLFRAALASDSQVARQASATSAR